MEAVNEALHELKTVIYGYFLCDVCNAEETVKFGFSLLKM